MVVFVPETAPGDLIRAEIVEAKGSFLVARAAELLEPSTARRQPVCPVFGRCGGCTWQHVEYAEQLRQKQRIVEFALKPLSKQQQFEIRFIVPSLDEFGYRNRIQVRKRGRAVGFFARASGTIVETTGCPIAEKDVSDRIVELRDHPDGKYEISRRVGGEVEIGGVERDAEAALFSQVNTRQNENLIGAVLDWTRELAREKSIGAIWDLYCGSGNFAFPLAENFPHVPFEAVELSQDAIARARRRDSHIQWHAADCARFLSRKDPVNDLLVLLDPPRAGAGPDVIRELTRIRPRQLVYISCNPMTFARDAQRFLESGFRLTRVQPFDMFPQTEHVELAALLHGVI